MKTFSISNTRSGHDLGTFAGETALDAYQAMMRDAGYRDEEHAESAGLSWAEIPGDLRVVEVSGDVTFETDTHRAEIHGGRVTISTYQLGHGWVWAGEGAWRNGRIDDCAAVLGDEVYDALEAGLRARGA